jgi:hypothetical protein
MKTIKTGELTINKEVKSIIREELGNLISFVEKKHVA